MVCWPWQGAVALKEQHPEMTQYHIIQNWLWLGAVNSLEEATTLIRTPAGFDHDGYKILCKPLLSGNYEITELDPANDQRASWISLNNSFTLRFVKAAGCAYFIEPARATVGSEQFIAQLPAPVNHKHHPPHEPKVVNVTFGNSDFSPYRHPGRVMMFEIHRHLPCRQFQLLPPVRCKGKRL